MITAIIAIPKYQSPPVDTLEQLWESDRQWVSDWPTNKALYMAYFENIENIEGRYYSGPLNKEVKPTAAALQVVLESLGQVVYFQSEGAAAAEIDRSGLGADSGRKFYYSKEKFRTSWSVLYRRKDLYYKEYLDRAVQVVTAMAIMSMQSRDFIRLDTIKARLREKKPPRDLGLIELKHSLTAITIISGIGVLGIITFIVELVMYYKTRPFRKLANYVSFIMSRKKTKKILG